jgi:serine protease Do
VFVLGCLAPLAAAAATPLAPLPGTSAGVAPGAPPTPTVAYAGQQHISRGVTTIERDSRVLGVGTVLSGDGRILTALSALGPTDLADVRYSDGSVVHARVGHRDKAWDLALLVPQSGHWVDGLSASETDPSTVDLKSLVAIHPGRPLIVSAHFRGAVDARAKEGSDDLTNALDIELQNSAPSIGAPLLDPDGGVVGVFVHACRATLPPVSAPGAPAAPPAPAAPAPCAPLVVAAPVASIRHFLAHTPASAVAPSPWLGIVGATDTTGAAHGVRVMAVAPGSPAEKGGLKSSDDHAQADLIVAVDGAPVDTPDKLSDVIAQHSIGDKVKLFVLGADDKFREVTVALRPAP